MENGKSRDELFLVNLYLYESLFFQNPVFKKQLPHPKSLYLYFSSTTSCNGLSLCNNIITSGTLELESKQLSKHVLSLVKSRHLLKYKQHQDDTQ